MPLSIHGMYFLKLFAYHFLVRLSYHAAYHAGLMHGFLMPVIIGALIVTIAVALVWHHKGSR